MTRPLIQLVLANLKIFYREPGILFWAFGFPLLIAWILGIAFDQKKQVIRKIGLVQNKNAPSLMADLQQRTRQDKYSQFNFQIAQKSQLQAAMKQGKILLYVERQVNTKKNIYYFDPNHQESYLTYLILEKQQQGGVIHELTGKGQRYIDFLIPGLVTMGIMNSCLWGIGWMLIELRMKKLLRRMIASPLRKWEFLLAQFITRLLLTFLETLMLLIFAFYYFDFSNAGSFWAIGLLFLTGNIAFSGIAVAVSSRAVTTQIANGLINAVSLPMMILSGIFFSYQSFPDWAVIWIQYLPLTLLTDAMRSVFLQGYGIDQLWAANTILTIYGLTFFGLGLKIYKWE